MNAELEILTVTFNPAIDETVFVDRLVPGTVHRARELRRRAGGKGVNVAAMLAQAGFDVAVTGFLGRDNAAVFERLFQSLGLRDRFVRVPGETRIGIKILDRDTGETTDLNLPGLEPAAEHLSALEAVLREQVRPGLWVVFSGSLPPGLAPEDLARSIAIVRELGGLAAVDTSGAPLAAAVEQGVDLVKPNAEELSELVGRELAGIPDVLETAAELHAGGIAHVIVSLGQEGALFVAPDRVLLAGAPPASVISTVGAGDSVVAGYLTALVRGEPAAERARLAAAFAWCALESAELVLAPAAELRARAARISVQSLPGPGGERS